MNQVALRFKTKSATSKDVLRSLENLHRVLLEVFSQEQALDGKLADYVFFPLSHIFRETRELPSRVLELALQCLRILLESAWRHKLSANLGIQLLILLAFIAGGSPAQEKSKDTPEELALVVFECLLSLFDSLSRSLAGQKALTDGTNVPALGHAITVLLDGITDGISDQNQLAAVAAVDALLACLSDREVIASFFPGMVSSLTKALQIRTRSKRSYRFLQAGLNLLNKLLRLVLSDDAITELGKRSTEIVKKGSNNAKGFGPSWAKATAAQVKLALANIIRLRNHDRSEVRQALHQLCITVLETCRETMTESRTMMIETLITLSATDETQGDLRGQNALKQLAYTDSGLVGLIKASVHNWTLSLPRIVQTNDDSAKARIAGQISTSMKLLSELESRTDTLDYDVAMSLRDSVLAIIPAQTALNGPQSQHESSLQLIPANGQQPSKSFSPILMSGRAEQETLLTLSSMVARLSNSSSSFAVIRTMLDEARASTGKALLANFWLALNFLRNMSASADDLDLFLELGPATPDPRANLLEELYSLSLRILTQSNNEEDEPDWRLQGLALEAIALQSHHLREEFRTELVDALYPIVQLLASPQPSLRSHAITCLNLVSSSNNYPSPSALVIANVDYLVNAVGLKLNTFDISPQAPQVLLMMIRLCGASLIPYLDDLVASVFAALDCFHGYPRLVELLFEVLGAIVDEGAKASALALLTDGGQTPKPDHRKAPLRPRSVADVAAELAHARARKETANDAELADPRSSDDSPQAPPSSSTDVEPPPIPKTYQTFLSITSLTRHYLHHASPTLRTHLLHLITSALPALATRENSLLPLIATLWPLVARRLLDPEPYVVIAVAEAVSAMCVCAGDFLATRVEGEWGAWSELLSRVQGRIKAERRGKGVAGGRRGVYVYGATYRVWDALVTMLVAVLRHVRVSDEMVDDALEMLGESLGTRADVREVLEGLNPDAVWLALERRREGRGGGAGLGAVPTMEGFVFKAVEF